MSSIRARLRPRPMPLNIFQDIDGLPRIILTEPTGSSAEVLLYGGQVVSWKNERKKELLFMSSKANWKQYKAIRGGISVCFPQFGNLGSLEQHASARNRLWSLDRDPSPLPPSDNQSSVDLILKSTGVDLKNRPCSFEFRLRISVSAGKLILIPRVRNTDNKALSFTLSISNYLSVSDISEVRVEGLETLDYFDNLMNRSRFTEQADAITFDGQMDRVYLRTPTKIAVIDHEKKRTFVLQKNAMPDAVVWNPGYRKAKALPDLGDDDYKFMICVDSAAIETPIVLKPNEEWKGYQELSNVSSSYCSGQLDPCKATRVALKKALKDRKVVEAKLKRRILVEEYYCNLGRQSNPSPSPNSTNSSYSRGPIPSTKSFADSQPKGEKGKEEWSRSKKGRKEKRKQKQHLKEATSKGEQTKKKASSKGEYLF